MGFKLKSQTDDTWYPDKGGVIKDAKRPWIVNAFLIWSLNFLVLACPIVGIAKGSMEYRRARSGDVAAAAVNTTTSSVAAGELRCRYSWPLQCEPADGCVFKGLAGCRPR